MWNQRKVLTPEFGFQLTSIGRRSSSFARAKTLRPSLGNSSPFDKLFPSLILRKFKLRPWIRAASSTRSVKSNPSSVSRERGVVDEKEKRQKTWNQSPHDTHERKSRKERCVRRAFVEKKGKGKKSRLGKGKKPRRRVKFPSVILAMNRYRIAQMESNSESEWGAHKSLK